MRRLWNSSFRASRIPTSWCGTAPSLCCGILPARMYPKANPPHGKPGGKQTRLRSVQERRSSSLLLATPKAIPSLPLSMQKLVVILGTNASGKSDLGIRLAKHLGGEIVSADSRQVYIGLDMGTGKITRSEERRVG